MTTISAGEANAVPRSERYPGGLTPVDIKQFSAVSAASDFAFLAADTDKDSSLSIDEFAALGKKDPSDAKTQALFAVVDGDGDGKLSSQEVRSSGLLSPANIQTLLDIDDVGAFMVSQADADGNGALSYDEYVNTRGAGPVTVTFTGVDGKTVEMTGGRLDAAPAIFAQMDANGDGQLSSSELNAHLEAEEGMASYEPSAGANRTSTAFVSLNDTDGDNALSAEEIAAAASTSDMADSDADGLVAAADRDRDGKVSGDEFAALAAERQSSFGFVSSGGESATASDIMLAQLLRSTYVQLTDAFVGSATQTDLSA